MFYVQIIININHANAIMLKYYFHYQLYSNRVLKGVVENLGQASY